MRDKAERSREEGYGRIIRAARRNWLWEQKYDFESGEAWGRWHRNEGHLRTWQPGATIRGMCATR